MSAYRLRVCCLLLLLILSLLCASGFSSDAKQLAEAESLIDRATKASSLTGSDGVPFFLQLRFGPLPGNARSKAGGYKLWWAAHDKWRAQADANGLQDVEVRNAQGLWLRQGIDPELDAIFGGARRFPFGGQLLRWNEKIVGLRERKVNGVKLSCVATERKDENRDLCFDPKLGVLIQITTSHTVFVFYHFEHMVWVTEYREYASLGDKLLPGEIEVSSNGRVIASIRLGSVAMQPKTAFADELFEPPQGYRVWPGCDQYEPAALNKNYSQPPGILNYAWFVGPQRVSDGVRITIGPDGKAQDVQLINPLAMDKDSKHVLSAFMNQTYDPAICDGKPVVGMLVMDFDQK